MSIIINEQLKLSQLLTMEQYQVKTKLIRMFPNENHIINGKGFVAYTPYMDAPCLVAHMDTCNDEEKKIPKISDLKINGKKMIISLSKTAHKDVNCLGADDRLGVWMAMQLIGSGYNVIFTEDEESGCIGAKELSDSKYMKEINEKCSCYLELDKAGHKKYCNYYSNNSAMEAVLKAFDMKETRGSCSDIIQITDATDTASANISIGYYEEHRRSEHIKLRETIETLNKLNEIAEYLTGARYKNEYKPPVYNNRGNGFYRGGGYGFWQYEDYWDDFHPKTKFNNKEVKTVSSKTKITDKQGVLINTRKPNAIKTKDFVSVAEMVKKNKSGNPTSVIFGKDIK